MFELDQRDWITKVFFYELRDADATNICQWGIVRNNGARKQAYWAYQDHIAAHPPAIP
jgi:hypothetical protein